MCRISGWDRKLKEAAREAYLNAADRSPDPGHVAIWRPMYTEGVHVDLPLGLVESIYALRAVTILLQRLPERVSTGGRYRAS